MPWSDEAGFLGCRDALGIGFSDPTSVATGHILVRLALPGEKRRMLTFNLLGVLKLQLSKSLITSMTHSVMPLKQRLALAEWEFSVP